MPAPKKHVPDERDLVDAFNCIRMSEPSLGFKRVFETVRDQNPDWKLNNAAKERMRKLFRKDDADSTNSYTTGKDSNTHYHSSTASTSASESPVPGDYLENDDEDNGIDVSDPQTLEGMARCYLQIANQRPANGFPVPPPVTSPVLLRSIMQQGNNDISILGATELGKDVCYLPYKLFWAEWMCFVGPHPYERLPPPMPYVPKEEQKRFRTLFPNGQGGWRGPTGHEPPFSFKDYAHYSLRADDRRFRHSREWLEWVLTRTQDKSVAGSVNCALILFFGSKARHLGRGKIERRRVRENFARKELRNDQLV